MDETAVLTDEETAYTATDMPKMPFGYRTTSGSGHHLGKGHVYLTDADGKTIATILGAPKTKLALLDFIIQASRK